MCRSRNNYSQNARGAIAAFVPTVQATYDLEDSERGGSEAIGICDDPLQAQVSPAGL